RSSLRSPRLDGDQDVALEAKVHYQPAKSVPLSTWPHFVAKHRTKLKLLAASSIVLGLGLPVYSTQPYFTLTAIALLAGGIVLLVASQRKSQPAGATTPGLAFRGLLPFQEADRDHFYGRDSDTLLMLKKVTSPEFRFGVLYGDSGCGKTSLLRAGVLPRL